MNEKNENALSDADLKNVSGGLMSPSEKAAQKITQAARGIELNVRNTVAETADALDVNNTPPPRRANTSGP